MSHFYEIKQIYNCSKYCINVPLPHQFDYAKYIGGISTSRHTSQAVCCCVVSHLARLFTVKIFYSRYFLGKIIAKMADWQHGLCGCFNDCGTCIVTFIAPCYTHGKNAEAVGESCLLCGLSVLVPVLDIFTMASIRTIVREQHGIAGSMANDFLATFFCSCCSIIQVAQQVKGSPGFSKISRT